MPDVAVNLQTPILKSVRDRLKELQEEHGHDNAGETIAFLLDGEMMLSDEAARVIEDWRDAHGFETNYLALQDLLLEFRDRYLGAKKIARD